MNSSILLKPIKIGNIEFKNRCVMAAMTRVRCPINGIPGSL